MFRLLIVTIFTTFSFCMVLDLEGQVEVDGDAKLLVQIRDANREHRKELVGGEWVGVVTRSGDQGTIKFQWNGDNSRIEYDLKSSSILGGRPESGLAIRKKSEQIIYFKSAATAQHYNGLGRSFLPPLECHPNKSWYEFQEMIPWSELLDHETPRGNVTKFEVSHDEDGHVVIQRHHDNGSRYQIVVAPELGFRILKLETFGNAVGQTNYSSEIEWAKTKPGAYYPKRLRNWQSAAGGGRGEPKLDIEISEFKSSPIDSGRFGVKKSDFPEGTKFKYFNKDGSKRKLHAT